MATAKASAAAASVVRPQRVLVLHGHGQTADDIRSRIGFLRSETKKTVDWHFLNGPLAMTQAEAFGMLSARLQTPPAGSDAEPPKPSGDRATELDETASKTIVRSWFDFTAEDEQGQPRYRGLGESLRAIDELSKEVGPFDGVLGFSQGAVLAAIWVARQQRALLGLPLPSLLPDGGLTTNMVDTDAASSSRAVGVLVPQRDAPLRFAVFCSGLLPNDVAERASIVDVPAPATPIATVHCYGESDAIIEPVRSEALRNVRLFTTPPAATTDALTHPGGHAVVGAYRKRLKAFFAAQASSQLPKEPTQ